MKHSSFAIQTVGHTKSVLTIIYSIAIGMSMAATAIVARRIGEKDPVAAAKVGMQAIIIAFAINSIMSIFGVIFAKDILILTGSSVESAEHGFRFTQIMIGSSLCICFCS